MGLSWEEIPETIKLKFESMNIGVQPESIDRNQ